jgi:hypothetical protein
VNAPGSSCGKHNGRIAPDKRDKTASAATSNRGICRRMVFKENVRAGHCFENRSRASAQAGFTYAHRAQGSTGDCDQPSLSELRLAGHFRQVRFIDSLVAFCYFVANESAG